MAALRSVLHLLWMLITVVPVAIYLLTSALLGVKGHRLYRMARFWLWLSIAGAKHILAIRYVVEGEEHLPTDNKPAVMLVKHQSTYETFLMPVIMPRDLA
jgi:1-acyl-sn-glycerol-3-phosphate acyltransferase